MDDNAVDDRVMPSFGALCEVDRGTAREKRLDVRKPGASLPSEGKLVPAPLSSVLSM